MANIFRTISTKLYQRRPGIVHDVTKNIWCVLGFAVPIDVQLQNANAKFNKVVQRQCSGEAESVYISVPQIYSGQHVPNFITIGRIL